MKIICMHPTGYQCCDQHQHSLVLPGKHTTRRRHEGKNKVQRNNSDNLLSVRQGTQRGKWFSVRNCSIIG